MHLWHHSTFTQLNLHRLRSQKSYIFNRRQKANLLPTYKSFEMRYCNQFFILALLIPISIDRSIALTNDLGEECYVSDRGEVVCDTVTSLDRIYEEDDTKYDDRLQQVQCNDGHERKYIMHHA